MHTVAAGHHISDIKLVPPQNLGPGCTLWSVPPQNFCLQMLLDPQIVLLCVIKNTKIDFGLGLYRSPIPYSWWGGDLAAPLPKNPTPAAALRASNFAATCLLTFDYLPPTLVKCQVRESQNIAGVCLCTLMSAGFYIA